MSACFECYDNNCRIFQILYYSTSILQTAGLDEEFAQFSTLFMNILVIPAAYFSAHIVDRAGRKTLLLCGYSGVLISGTILSAGLIFQVIVKSLVI